MSIFTLSKMRNSLILRKFLVIFLPVFLGLGAVIAILYKAEADSDRRLVGLNESQSIKIQSELVINDFSLARADLNILAATNELKDFLEYNNINISMAEAAKELIAREYLSLGNQRQSFDLISFVDTNGQEIIRVDFSQSMAVIVPETALKNKASYSWFQQSLKLKLGEIFVSPLELDVEQGQIIIPIKPTVRLITPIFDRQGTKRGLIILNYRGRKIIDNLVPENSTAIGNLMLVNEQGYWLRGRTREDEWGFMIPERFDRTFAKDFPQAWQYIGSKKSGQFFTTQGLFTFETISPQLIVKGEDINTANNSSNNLSNNLINSLATNLEDNPPAKAENNTLENQEWKVISFIPASVFDNRLRPSFYRFLALYFSLLAASAIGIYFFSLSQVKRDRAEHNLRRSESRYQKLAANLPGMIYQYTLRPNGFMGFTYASEGCREIYGLEPHAITSEHELISTFIHAEDMPKLQQLILASAKNLTDFVWDGRLINSSETKWVRAISRPEKQSNGDVIWDGILIDITEMKTVELALRDLKEQLEAKVTERTKELKQSELELIQKAGDLEVALQQIQQAQSQLVQNEKMSSLGQLVAGIAHEINNPVNFIYGNLEHASRYSTELIQLLSLYQRFSPAPTVEIREMEDDIEIDFIKEDLPKLISSMKVGADRIQKIVLSLRNFSRMDESEMKEVNIHEGIDSTLMILQSRLKAKSDRPEIKIIKNYDRLPPIECYAAQLNQVFMNIIGNAIDALEVANSLQKNLHITISTKRVDYHKVEIRIADNGCGIPESARSKLFDPFFTTKDVGKGTGLGLAISYQIIADKHQGSLSFASELGKGTEFTIIIPMKQSFGGEQISA
jgi:signal transduction histidine kinase